MKKFKIRNKLAAASAFAMTVAMTGPAFAGELADAATAGMDPAEVTAIGVAVLTVCAVIFMIRSGKRVSN